MLCIVWYVCKYEILPDIIFREVCTNKKKKRDVCTERFYIYVLL
jgi:hypothetical protein